MKYVETIGKNAALIVIPLLFIAAGIYLGNEQWALGILNLVCGLFVWGAFYAVFVHLRNSNESQLKDEPPADNLAPTKR
jgi:hypothetical protein